MPETEQLLNKICDPKVAKKRKRNAVQPIALEQEAARQLREDLPNYYPPLYLRKFSFKSLLHPQTELEAFHLYIIHDIIEILV